MTVCFTGKMPEKRSFYEARARELGMEPVDSVTASLGLLVTAEADSTSSKAVKAKKAGVKIITLDEFNKYCEENGIPYYIVGEHKA